MSRCESGAPFGVRFMVGGVDVDVVPSVSIPPGGVDLGREKDAGRTAEKVASKVSVVIINPDGWGGKSAVSAGLARVFIVEKKDQTRIGVGFRSNGDAEFGAEVKDVEAQFVGVGVNGSVELA